MYYELISVGICLIGETQFVKRITAEPYQIERPALRFLSCICLLIKMFIHSYSFVTIKVPVPDSHRFGIWSEQKEGIPLGCK